VRTGLRGFAKLYAAILVNLALYAWYTAIRFPHSSHVHLSPDILLAIATMPSSLTLSPLYDHWPDFMSLPFIQIAWLHVCGVFQVGVLFLVSHQRQCDEERRAPEKT